MDLKGILGKAKQWASGHPDAVRTGLDKVEGAVNAKTGGKYADQVAKGSDAVESALGVPREAKNAFAAGAAEAGQPVDPVSVEPIEAPAPIDAPEPLPPREP